MLDDSSGKQELKRLKTLIITLIRLYQYIFSPLLPSSCRFTPTCSEYSIEAVKTYGAFKGVFLALKRIVRCHPFNAGGYDPVK